MWDTLPGDRPPSVRPCDGGVHLEIVAVTVSERQVHGTQINIVSIASMVS